MTGPTLDSFVVTGVEIESGPRLLIDENVEFTIYERHDCLRIKRPFTAHLLYLQYLHCFGFEKP